MYVYTFSDPEKLPKYDCFYLLILLLFFLYEDDIQLKMQVASGQYSWTRFVSQIWSHNSCCCKCHCYDLNFNRIIGYEKGRVISYFIFYYIYPR